MKRAIVIAKGEVQRVGYREAVEKIARRLHITGFIENLKPYDVRIVAEGEDANISKFIEQIEIKKFPIDVESTEVGFDTYKGEFEYFEIKRGDWHEELLERLDTAGALLYKSVELGGKSVELGGKSVELGEKNVKLAERTVELGEKSVELGEKSVAIGERSVALGEESVSIGKKMLKKQDDTIKAIERGKEEIVTEIKSLREDLRSYMEDRFARIEDEIEAIKAKIGMD
ncbi:MAG: acylphosphatase [Methanophagales archaeon ANME-1-THS]|nr:MAG: acylphosphatase [Methanophagales archaeon ANME-1-THS]